MFHHALDILTIYFKISGNLKKAFMKKTMKLRITKIFLLLCLFTSCSSVHLSCSSGWRATEDELTKDMVKPSLFYRPADEIASTIRGAKLAWTNEDDKMDDIQQLVMAVADKLGKDKTKAFLQALEEYEKGKKA